MEGVLRPRGAGFDIDAQGDRFATTLARDDLMVLVWRVLASVAGALAPAEFVLAQLATGQGQVSLRLTLPAAMAQAGDPFAIVQPDQRPVLSAGMFGAGFTFRLARAEAVAAGGNLHIGDGLLVLTLPHLTAS
jgi:two-component system, OmpR family, sensor kinase